MYWYTYRIEQTDRYTGLAIGLYLNLCWPISMTPYGVTQANEFDSCINDFYKAKSRHLSFYIYMYIWKILIDLVWIKLYKYIL